MGKQDTLNEMDELYQKWRSKALACIKKCANQAKHIDELYEQRRALLKASIQILDSIENYNSERIPEEDWDEYDYMMFPRWAALRAAIAKAQFGPWRDLKSYSENDIHVLHAHAAALKAERDYWRNLVDDLEQNGIYLDSKAYYEGRIAELETAIALSISDINCGRVDSARDRLFEMVKPDEKNNAS